MDIRAIEYFVQTFKEQNISKAANTLFISQQGLSKSIRSLETELGVPLFYRTKTGVEPTEYANLILPYAQAIVSNYIQLKNSIDELGNTHTGTIKLGLVNGAISAMPIGEIIFDFISIYPDITIVPKIENDYLCENLLSEERLDLAILVQPVDDGKIRYSTVCEADSCVLINRDDPLAQKDIVSIYDLKDRPLITVDYRYKMSRVLKEAAEKYGLHLNEAFHSSQPADFVELAANKLGVAVMSTLWIDTANIDPRVHVAKISDSDLKMKFCIAYNGSRIRTQNEKLFYDYLRKRLLAVYNP